jgi:hypothetical protein
VKSEYGNMVPVADAVTPGNSRTRRTMSKIKRRESAGVFLIKLKSNSLNDIATRDEARIKAGRLERATEE